MDTLKPLEEVAEPDERWANFGYPDPVDFSFHPIALSERHAAISAISLTPCVPEHIREHFETAKNLLLYAWFVYRFIPVAESLHPGGVGTLAICADLINQLFKEPLS